MGGVAGLRAQGLVTLPRAGSRGGLPEAECFLGSGGGWRGDPVVEKIKLLGRELGALVWRSAWTMEDRQPRLEAGHWVASCRGVEALAVCRYEGSPRSGA